MLGLKPVNATEFFREVGYCTQFDSFPRGLTGLEFLLDSLMLHGMHPRKTRCVWRRKLSQRVKLMARRRIA